MVTRCHLNSIYSIRFKKQNTVFFFFNMALVIGYEIEEISLKFVNLNGDKLN